MKKIISVILAMLMLSLTAFADSYVIDGENTKFNRVSDEIKISYSGNSGEYMTVFVYDVTGIEEASDETPWSIEETPIIGLDQAVGSGEFVIKVKPSFTGNVVVIVGGELGSSTKILLHIENGVPEAIVDTEYDAGGDMAQLEDGKTITIQQGKKLLNAIVSTIGTGKVEYFNDNGGKVDLSGDILFNGDGEIDAVSGKMVEIKSGVSNGTYNIGYINKTRVSADNTKYVVTLTASDGKSVTKSFDLNCLEGEVRVRVGVENVPEGITINQTTVVVE